MENGKLRNGNNAWNGCDASSQQQQQQPQQKMCECWKRDGMLTIK